MKILTSIIILILFSGCARNVTIKQTVAPKIKIDNIFIKDNDIISNDLKAKLLNYNFKVYNANTHKVKFIIKTKTIQNNKITNSIRLEDENKVCLRYSQKNDKCMFYRKKAIKCQTNDYSVSTNFEVFKKDNSVILNKNYTKTSSKYFCEDKKRNYTDEDVFSLLKEKVINKFLSNITSKIVSNKILIMEISSKDVKFIKQEKELLSKSLDLLEDDKLKLAKIGLLKLQYKNSYVVNYNLSLIYKKQHNNSKAKELLKKAKIKCQEVNDLENLEIILKVINQ